MGLKVFSPLWRKDPEALMRDLISSGVRAVVVAVMAEGLGPDWLGRSLDASALDGLLELQRKVGVSPSGEGGEYESLVVDSPIHTRRLELVEAERIVSRDRAHLVVSKLELRDKI